MQLDEDTVRRSLPCVVMAVDQQHGLRRRARRESQRLEHPPRPLQVVLGHQQVEVVKPPSLVGPIQPPGDGGALQQQTGDLGVGHRSHHTAQRCIQGRPMGRRRGPAPKLGQTVHAAPVVG